MPNPAVNVLLIEDDYVDTEAVRRAFGKLHIDNEIPVAIDAYEALTILRGEVGHDLLPWPYVILPDIQLPRMNGIEFLHALRRDAESKSSIVFVLPTSCDEEDRVAAYREQVAGYFLKKNTEQEFLILPEMLENHWQMVEWPHRL